MKRCVQCGAEFEPKSDIHYFCSDKCRTAARRKAQTADLNRLLATIEQSLADLRKIGGRS